MNLWHTIAGMPWREITAGAALVAWASFWVCYSLLTRWWKTPEGQNVWLVSLALTLVFLVIEAAYLWPQYDIRPWFPPVTYSVLAILATQRIVHLFRRRREKRRRRESR